MEDVDPDQEVAEPDEIGSDRVEDTGLDGVSESDPSDAADEGCGCALGVSSRPSETLWMVFLMSLAFVWKFSRH